MSKGVECHFIGAVYHDCQQKQFEKFFPAMCIIANGLQKTTNHNAYFALKLSSFVFLPVMLEV